MVMLGEDGEFVSAETGHGVARAHRVRQQSCDPLEEFIASFVPEFVIDHLEMIEVDEDHSDQRIRAQQAGVGVVEAVLEVAAIRQAGQRVGDGQPIRPVLGLLAFGHVGRLGDHLQRPAVCVTHE